MPDFSPCPINNDQEVNNWLKFYSMSAPLTVLSVFISSDPGLDLRVEHSHGWGEDGGAGRLGDLLDLGRGDERATGGAQPAPLEGGGQEEEERPE